ncbi:MAG: hypothetical protein M5U14_05865 [Acidimicrobiia bacterium]|nr:hypothetical protein [Acidimicrobiia bacterium]
MARVAAERPITKADIEAKLEEVRRATEAGTEQAKGVAVAVGVVAVGALVVGAYLLGRRRGRRRRTVVEIRRV